MSKLDLLIFDCDGVLVDSEYLSILICSELITEAGYPITAEEMSERYSGLILIDILKDIEKTSGVPFSAQIIDQAEDIFKKRIETELLGIDGVREAVAKIDLPYCICSNSVSENIEKMLKVVGLYDLFEGRIFSAREVGSKQQKPAPDVYLYAAKTLGFAPARTAVLEDSIHGVHGACSAGMRVIGFTGGGHSYPSHADALTEAGAETVISRMDMLPTTLKAMEDWQDI